MSVRIGIGLGQGIWPSDTTSTAFLWQFIDRCEASPIDSIWISDRIVGPSRLLEPITALAAIAGRTKRLKFGPSVLALSLRNPVVLAKEIATLDYISNGRMLPAVGLGTENESEYRACGVRKWERAQRTDEAISLLRRLWTDDHVTHHGRFYLCDDITIEPKPAQSPLPIWIGGRSEPALQRTAKLGDGWLVSAVSPQELSESVQKILQYAEGFGREFDPGHIGVILDYCIAGSHKEALAEATKTSMLRRPDLPQGDYAALDAPEPIRALLERYIEAGASKFVLRPACSPERLFQQVDLLAQEIIPYIHD